MRYKEYNIVLQEIPNEVSLCFSMTGCNLRCIGCHSPFLWKNTSGDLLSLEILDMLISKYKRTISCILFMGGEWNGIEFVNTLKYIKSLGIKTALYTGLDFDNVDISIIKNLDYIKYGPWIKDLGGLDSINTNQVLLNLNTMENMNYYFMKD